MTACLPPAGTPSETWHWLRDENDRLSVACWQEMRWAVVGVVDQIHPTTMARWGYQYVEPVTPPRAEGQDGGGDADPS